MSARTTAAGAALALAFSTVLGACAGRAGPAPTSRASTPAPTTATATPSTSTTTAPATPTWPSAPTTSATPSTVGPPVAAPSGPAVAPPPGALAPLAFRLFPTTDAWNTRVDGAAVDPASGTLLSSIGTDGHLHMDFGADWDGGPFGIPYTVVGAGQPQVAVSFDYADESDPGPYPIPADAPIEGGANADGDRHVLVVDSSTHRLYELYDARRLANGSWHAGSGAVFDLDAGTTRPAGWTSADAAGLPILPGLVRYEEVAAGHIDHAIRFTVASTRKAYVAPARHWASSSTDPSLPPMGMRVRLNAGFDLSGYPPQARVILQAMKSYGMIVADNGSSWYVSGTPDARWSDEQLNTLKNVPGSAFEVVAMGAVTTG